MTDTLKPCPFCDGQPITNQHPNNIEGTEFVAIAVCYCGGLSATAHKMSVRSTLPEAVEATRQAWNQRAALAQPEPEPPTIDDVVDALNVFNPARPNEEGDPWEASDYIMVSFLPAFIHSVGKAWYLSPSAQPEQQTPATLSKEQIGDIVREHLRGLYYCGRVWEAWSAGTMSEDDFSPAEELETADEIADSLLAAMTRRQGTQSEQQAEKRAMLVQPEQVAEWQSRVGTEGEWRRIVPPAGESMAQRIAYLRAWGRYEIRALYCAQPEQQAEPDAWQERQEVKRGMFWRVVRPAKLVEPIPPHRD